MNLSEKYFEQSKELMPGGVNSPVRAFRSVKNKPVFIRSGKGCRVTDVDGNEYIDFVSSWGPLILGHAHPKVIAAITKVAKNGTSFGAPTELEIKLAEKVIEMVPSVEMVRLVNSGTEATMSAIRLARGVTGRDKILKFEGCYHGHGDSFLIKAGSGALTFGEPDSPGVPKALAQETLNANYNDLESVQQLFDAVGPEIAAIIVEPIAGNMGVIPPAPGFLQGLRSICDKYQTILIFDEVMTGFRVHPGGAQALYNVYPDLTTMGKVMGGGLPMAAYGGKKEIMQNLSPKGSVYQAGTLSGNPIAVAAGLATLEAIAEPGFFDTLNEKAISFFNGTQQYITENDLPLTLNYVNSMGGLFFKKDGVGNFGEATKSDTDQFADYFNQLLTSGIYIAPSQYEALFVSQAHEPEDLEKASNVMYNALAKVLKQ